MMQTGRIVIYDKKSDFNSNDFHSFKFGHYFSSILNPDSECPTTEPSGIDASGQTR